MAAFSEALKPIRSFTIAPGLEWCILAPDSAEAVTYLPDENVNLQ